ncbi:MAG: hypothetical protein EBE86_030660 [Hormoscilla sp. GUM202]|nr:hypothetical protein [Hormoscilla sp. GUM202]
MTNYFGDILPNSIGDRLVIELSFRLLKKLRVSGHITPVDRTTSRSPYGASIAWQLGNRYNSQTLSLSWQSQEYDYGDDPFGNRLLIKDNIFTVSFRVGARLGPSG